MKKLICILLSVLLMSTGSFAQNNKAPKKPAQKDAPAAQTTATAKDDATTKPKLKKDGTPDMRYSANKKKKTDEKPTAAPVKKDGTPDMRHKANKDAAAAAKKK